MYRTVLVDTYYCQTIERITADLISDKKHTFVDNNILVRLDTGHTLFVTFSSSLMC